MTNFTLTFIVNTDNVSFSNEEIIVLGDELVMRRFCVTACGTEIYAIDAEDLAVADSYINNGIIPTRIKQTLNTKEETTMNNMTDELLNKMIAMVDSYTLDEEIAMNLQAQLEQGADLEELLIACVDSDTVSLGIAKQLLGTNEENNMTEELEEKMIAMIDSGTLNEEVALHLQSQLEQGGDLEELLIACVDSDTVDLDIAQQLLGISKAEQALIETKCEMRNKYPNSECQANVSHDDMLVLADHFGTDYKGAVALCEKVSDDKYNVTCDAKHYKLALRFVSGGKL